MKQPVIDLSVKCQGQKTGRQGRPAWMIFDDVEDGETPGVWQCPGCKTFYAPSRDHCYCQYRFQPPWNPYPWYQFQPVTWGTEGSTTIGTLTTSGTSVTFTGGT